MKIIFLSAYLFSSYFLQQNGKDVLSAKDPTTGHKAVSEEKQPSTPDPSSARYRPGQKKQIEKQGGASTPDSAPAKTDTIEKK